MDHLVEHPRFQQTKLSIVPPKIPGLFAPSLYVNGHRAERKGKTYLVEDDDGQTVPIKVRVTMRGQTKVLIGTDQVDLGEEIPWYAFAFSLLPMVLVIGGALGGAAGGIAFAINVQIFQSGLNKVAKYGAALLVSVTAGLVYLGGAAALTFTMPDVDFYTLQEMERRIDETAPKQIDEQTRLDGATATHEGFTYEYTVSGPVDSSFEESLRDIVRPNLCSNKTLKKVMETGYHISYDYRHEDGRHLFMTRFVDRDCDGQK